MRGRTIAILESRVGEHFAELVAKHGATPLWAPALAEEPDVDPAAIAALIDQCAAKPPSVAIFQTGVGTKALFDTTDALNLTSALVALLAAATVVVRGPKPVGELRRRGVRIDRTAAEPYTTAEVLQCVDAIDLRGKTVLVQRYGERNAELDDTLEHHGAKVIDIPTYRWALPHDIAPIKSLLTALEGKKVDAVVFTSASQVRNLFTVAAQLGHAAKLAKQLNDTVIASIGPVCSRALAEHGINVSLEASPPKLGPLLSALQAKFST